MSETEEVNTFKETLEMIKCLRKIEPTLQDIVFYFHFAKVHAHRIGEVDSPEAKEHHKKAFRLCKKSFEVAFYRYKTRLHARLYPDRGGGEDMSNTITVRIENIRDMQQRLLNAVEWAKKGWAKKGRDEMVGEFNCNQVLIHLRYLRESLKDILEEK